MIKQLIQIMKFKLIKLCLIIFLLSVTQCRRLKRRQIFKPCTSLTIAKGSNGVVTFYFVEGSKTQVALKRLKEGTLLNQFLQELLVYLTFYATDKERKFINFPKDAHELSDPQGFFSVTIKNNQYHLLKADKADNMEILPFLKAKVKSKKDKPILPLISFGKDKEGFFFLNEKLKYSLLDFLNQKITNLDITLKYKIMLKLTVAVRKLHAGGILHKDLKLENVLVKEKKNGDFDLFLTDFGFSCRLEGEKDKACREKKNGSGLYSVAAIKICPKTLPAIHRDFYSLAIIFAILVHPEIFNWGNEYNFKYQYLLPTFLEESGFSGEINTIIKKILLLEPESESSQITIEKNLYKELEEEDILDNLIKKLINQPDKQSTESTILQRKRETIEFSQNFQNEINEINK